MPMSREEMDAFLAEPRNAIVATVNPDGFPQLTPIWFHWERRHGLLQHDRAAAEDEEPGA